MYFRIHLLHCVVLEAKSHSLLFYINKYLFFTGFQVEEIGVLSVSQRLWTLMFIILYCWDAIYASSDRVARKPSDSIWSGKGKTWMKEQFQMNWIRSIDSVLFIFRFHSNSSKVWFGKVRKPPHGLRYVWIYYVMVNCDRGVYFCDICRKWK